MRGPERLPRRIGLDLDNTIVDYGKLLREEVRATGLIEPVAGSDKRSLRDALRALPDGEAAWIRLQARIYGPALCKATPFLGACEFVRRACAAGIELVIVSHKTRFAVADSNRCDLRDAARSWLSEHNILAPDALSAHQVFFEGTRAEKIARIAELRVGAFIDDLVEVFAEPAFPAGVERWLFTPSPADELEYVDRAFDSWKAIERHVLGDD